MPFYAPEWMPKLPYDPPDSISVADFMLDEHYGRHPLGYSHPPFTCGLSGKTYSALEVQERVDYLARGLAKELGIAPNKGTEWDKVIGLFSLNTVRCLENWERIVSNTGRLIRLRWHGQRIDWAAFRPPPMPHIALPS
jgi:hypothetical protein